MNFAKTLAKMGHHLIVIYQDEEALIMGEHLESTRGVSISTEDDGYEVRITTLATKADYVLFRDSIKVVHNIVGGDIYDDDEEPIADIGSLDNNWISERMDNDFEMITILATQKEDSVVELDGLVRPFCIGNDLLAALQIQKGEVNEDAKDRLYERFLYIQWGLREDLEMTTMGRMDIDQTGDQNQFKPITMYFYNQRDFIRNAEYIILPKEDFCKGGKDYIVVPFTEFMKVAPETWQRIDERQFLAPHLSEQEYSSFWDRAIKVAKLVL